MQPTKIYGATHPRILTTPGWVAPSKNTQGGGDGGGGAADTLATPPPAPVGLEMAALLTLSDPQAALPVPCFPCGSRVEEFDVQPTFAAVGLCNPPQHCEEAGGLHLQSGFFPANRQLSIEQKDRKAVQSKTSLPNQSMIWHQVKFTPHNIYSTIPWVDNKPTCCPTPKEFISPVSSCSQVWGGLMWVIGWHKSYHKNQISGEYIKQFGPEDQIYFHSHYFKSSWVGEIIDDFFKKLAHEPVRNHGKTNFTFSKGPFLTWWVT
ncbi:hypothetical protein VP01_1374g2 [Puccinia sorghi]|uniref:Tet-like 2OG-Fe(II) oxygenase domain-containing protein n=1 Tax=Puccinia sorghi TaxID=27349 RepID=A0A0L6VLK2_9BASI|nr:hypothetical protein VP01_1374g2 [Puccinia sorghi]